MIISGDELQALILKLSDRMARVEQAYARTILPALAPAEMAALRYIVRNSPVRMSDLAQNVGLPQSSATNLADKLVSRALIERERPETNRRVVMLSATRTAHRLIKDIEAEQVALCDELVAGLEPGEAGVIRGLLNQLSDSRAE